MKTKIINFLTSRNWLIQLAIWCTVFSISTFGAKLFFNIPLTPAENTIIVFCGGSLVALFVIIVFITMDRQDNFWKQFNSLKMCINNAVDKEELDKLCSQWSMLQFQGIVTPKMSIESAMMNNVIEAKRQELKYSEEELKTKIKPITKDPSEYFRLKHFALYAKKWYAQSDDIWADVKKCLEADQYTPFDRMDIISIVHRNVCRINKKNVEDFVFAMIQEIHPNNCWKFGYYTEDHQWENNKGCTVKYDYETAILYYYKSIVNMSDRKVLGELNIRPDANVLPLREDITEESIQRILLNNNQYAA